MIVAIQGELGSFSEGAARRLLGADIEIRCCMTFDDLFASVRHGLARRGVVPVWNTIAGLIYDNAVRARAQAFTVYRELRYPVQQCLIMRPGTTTTPLRRVASHPIALQQCTRWFAAHPGCDPVAIADTAGGVRDLMAECLDANAVIASAAAAERYGAELVTTGVEDRQGNVTRFMLIGNRESSTPSHPSLGNRQSGMGKSWEWGMMKRGGRRR
ncbi:MAG TPA: prephenate dehydratase domain-containing protein [Gemmatimonadaceae bacterium]|nr:prephenate dehydratase domain-containing protein [Gemmatimonadaceae bacterium]